MRRQPGQDQQLEQQHSFAELRFAWRQPVQGQEQLGQLERQLERQLKGQPERQLERQHSFAEARSARGQPVQRQRLEAQLGV